MNQKTFLLLCIYLFFNLEEATGIRCYQCSSTEDINGEDNCGAYEDFHREKHVAVECNSDESKSPGTFCMKITQQSPRGFIWDGRWREVRRECASVAESGVTGVCNFGVLQNGVYWEKCYCSTDGCNSAVKLNFEFNSIIFILSLALTQYALLI
ncbi:hypothetical protein PGB90_008324 [Kerria lacca]